MMKHFKENTIENTPMPKAAFRVDLNIYIHLGSSCLYRGRTRHALSCNSHLCIDFASLNALLGSAHKFETMFCLCSGGRRGQNSSQCILALNFDKTDFLDGGRVAEQSLPPLFATQNSEERPFSTV